MHWYAEKKNTRLTLLQLALAPAPLLSTALLEHVLTRALLVPKIAIIAPTLELAPLVLLGTIFSTALAPVRHVRNFNFFNFFRVRLFRCYLP